MERVHASLAERVVATYPGTYQINSEGRLVAVGDMYEGGAVEVSPEGVALHALKHGGLKTPAEELSWQEAIPVEEADARLSGRAPELLDPEADRELEYIHKIRAEYHSS